MPLRFDTDAFAGVPKHEAARLLKKAEYIWDNRKVLNHTLLRHDLNPFLRWHVGDYRLIYTYDTDSDEMIVRLAGHRRDIYQQATTLRRS